MQSNDASSLNNIPYKPSELGRLFWLAAKKVAVADPEFSHKDNVRFALALYSGAYVNHIRLSDMVDCVINALANYYMHDGVNDVELRELFNPLRTDYAALTNQKWDQDQASEKIISACMNRLMLAQVRDGNNILVDLSGADVDYQEVWERIDREEKEELEAEKEKTLAVFEKCRCDGITICLRSLDEEWLYKVTNEEKGNMKADECLCEKAASRPLSFDCDFVIEKEKNEKPMQEAR
ncbi:MAG: hypothetical protein Q8K07_15890 [Methylicorpusculum sp.]|jgi:hypothetical protein|uniref:hypothetical protein n=1 Tax=Methylicorpusculum TaxID=2713642 RepID=UPI00135A0FF8|nr:MULTISPECIES: hypothetical protein [Methylicorpusculum]MCD2452031.1 hypothetical protein [Methylicorpusculum oleiharenae]MDP2203505.1 hypothetical protein [Methylicorpusculum sp.]